MRVNSTAAAALVFALLIAACGSTGQGADATDSSSSSTDPTSASTARAAAAAVPTTAPDTGADAAPVPSAGCGQAATVAGVTDATLTSGGVERTYRRFVPKAHDGATPLPLVLNFHGFTSNAEQQTIAAGFEPLAEREGFVVAAPQGLGTLPFWNAFRAEAAQDDIAFTVDLIDRLEADLCIDRSRVYATGMSNGGLMSSLIACDLADRVTAVAPVSGLQLPEPCATTRAVPMAVFYGSADKVLPVAGGLGDSVKRILDNRELVAGASEAQRALVGGLEFAPLDDNLERWAAQDGCGREAAEQSAAPDVKLLTWTGCDDGAEIRLYLVDEGGHTWPGSGVMASLEENPLGETLGHTTMNLSASETMWEFFSHYSHTPAA